MVEMRGAAMRILVLLCDVVVMWWCGLLSEVLSR